jgi:hypothetical protein
MHISQPFRTPWTLICRQYEPIYQSTWPKFISRHDQNLSVDMTKIFTMWFVLSGRRARVGRSVIQRSPTECVCVSLSVIRCNGNLLRTPRRWTKVKIIIIMIIIRKTLDRFTTKDSYTWNITHNTESTAVWDLKPERWGSPLVQGKYREEKACDKRGQ